MSEGWTNARVIECRSRDGETVTVFEQQREESPVTLRYVTGN